jgi:hypothetical protein
MPTASFPTREEDMPSSLATQAMTGSDETASAPASKTTRAALEPDDRINRAGRNVPRSAPPAKGTTKLQEPITARAWPRRRRRAMSVSTPSTNESRRSPICATPASKRDCAVAAGNSQRDPAGRARPKTSELNSTPATRAPNMGGCARRRATHPRSREEMYKVANAAQSTASWDLGPKPCPEA